MFKLGHIILLQLMLLTMPLLALPQSHSVTASLPDSSLVRLLVGDHWRDAESGRVELLSADLSSKDLVVVNFNKHARAALISCSSLNIMADSVRSWLDLPNVKVRFLADGLELSSLLPPAFSPSPVTLRPHVYSPDAETYALTGRSLAVWNSHGLYYESKLDRWEWQRARLFTTVEDLLSTSFVVPFLLPMLENSGALVYTPRERDLSPNAFFADNDLPSTFCSNGLRPVKKGIGYKASSANSKGVVPNMHNPFSDGTTEFYRLSSSDSLTFIVTSDVVDHQKKAVYISYTSDASNSDSVCFTVTHARGSSRYIVDERRAGGMWVFLGNHYIGPKTFVTVTGRGQVSVDAVRIGGGMGCVERNGSTSNFPAWAECARYNLQANGFDTSVYAVSGGVNDYTDDVNCRGEWVNALVRTRGLRIDAAFALHTDAYTAALDSTIGTLAIITTGNNTSSYSDGRSRSLARSLAYSIEQQVVSDIRKSWNSTWSHRGVWDKNYSESRRADVPSVLLELLSHQNINDVHFAQHPQFRFDVCRSIYKGILRYFNGPDAVVQPLPVANFGMDYISAGKLRLSWSSVVDSLELSSVPDKFFVYAHTTGGSEVCIGQTADTSIVVSQAMDNREVEYYVVAVNKGGKSFPSVSLTARLDRNAPKMLYVNGFDRLSAPAIVNERHWRGIADVVDEGVPYGIDCFRTGKQYDYDPESLWLDDDAPGCGASFADEEMQSREGSHLAVYGISPTHISQSKDYFENSSSAISFDSLRIDLRAQRTTWYGDGKPRHAIYTERFLYRLEQTIPACRSVFISGSYVGTDIQDKTTAERVAALLGFKHRTNNASRTAGVSHPDAIEPENGARTVERYKDSHMSSAIQYKNIVVRGY